ncbi:MAG: HAD-IIB family hydrolase [Eubacteriales bacterium]|nr:HAD-IIB family hydrolase [Eubacteriales bacterium]
MGACDGYYLYCDLDGTLLDDEKRISSENRSAILSFIEQGGHFGVATGRVPSLIGAVEHDLPVNAPCILFNGAGLYDLAGQKFLAMHPIDRDPIARATERLIALDRETCVQVFTDTAIYEINPDQRDDPQTVREQIPTLSLPFPCVSGPLLKVLVANASSELETLRSALEQDGMLSDISAFRSSDTYLELVAKGISKGTTLEDVRAHCGDVTKILAIGDYNNDLDMVSLADIGGAPANAIDEVKAAADIVLSVDNNHNCVARFLEAALGL